MLNKLLKWLKRLIKNIRKLMPGYEDVMQRASDYHSHFAGSQFQCMKPITQNDPRLGKIFTVRNIEPQRSGQILAVLNDGSKIPVELLNSNFNMLTDQSQALSEADVRAMHARLTKGSNLSAAMIGTLEPEQQEAIANKQNIAAPGVNADVNGKTLPPLGFASTEVVQQPQQLQQTNVGQTVAPKQDLTKQLFGMFTLQPTDLEFQVPVKLPTLDLIQMMYAQATDKEEFLTTFSTYVLQNIDLESIKKAMSTLMEPKAKKIRAPKS